MSDTINLTTQLVCAQLAHQRMDAEAITASIQAIHATLAALVAAEEVGQKTPQFESPTDSIQRHQITCLECGKAFKLLANRHLALHGLTPRGYKKKHGIPMTQPLSSQALTQQRRKQAKALDMGSELAAWREKRRQAAG